MGGGRFGSAGSSGEKWDSLPVWRKKNEKQQINTDSQEVFADY